MTRTPNLLILGTDEQRADTIGNPQLQAPHLNRLAQQSAVFERAYCTQPVCTPSRATLQTGLWPHTHECVHCACLPCPQDSIFIPPPPERLPRRAVRGLGAHSPQQTGPFHPLKTSKRQSGINAFRITMGRSDDPGAFFLGRISALSAPVDLLSPEGLIEK